MRIFILYVETGARHHLTYGELLLDTVVLFPFGLVLTLVRSDNAAPKSILVQRSSIFTFQCLSKRINPDSVVAG